MTKFGLREPVTRVEDQRLLSGQGQYTDDIHLPGMTYAYVLRSPHAHARINGTDAEAARAAPGVLAVLTGAEVTAEGLGDMPCLAEVENRDGTPRADTPRPILAKDRVRHVGDPVALIIGETLLAARDGAELIEVDYETLPAVTDTVGTTKAGAPQIWDHIPDNVCFDWEDGDKAAVDAAFAKASHITKLEVVNNRLVSNPMEPRSTIGDHDPETGRSTLYTPSQGVHFVLPQIADAILKFGTENLRVVTPNVGGGFGTKAFLYAEQALVVWAARKVERPVKWTSERMEAFLSDAQGRDLVNVGELALDADGHFLGLRVSTFGAIGAYLSNFIPFVLTIGPTGMLTGTYRMPCAYLNVKGTMTNTVPVDAYRGAGRPEAIYMIERLTDLAALEMGIDRIELRRRNFVTPEEMPYATPLHHEFDSGEFEALTDACMEKADWKGAPARKAEAESRGRLHGLGYSIYVERCGGGFPETATVQFEEDRTVTLVLGTQDGGQGHQTAYRQLMCDRLGIDAEAITILQGDSDLVHSGLTGGSRSLPVGGAAAAQAAENSIEKGRNVAAEMLEAAVADMEFGDGAFTVAGTDRTVSLFDVAAAARDDGNTLDDTYTQTPEAHTYPNGCHIVEIEIEPSTGIVEITRYTVIDDFGDTVNPMLLEGQVHGGVVQGAGQALTEQTVYDPDSGQLLSGSFMDYAMPRADQFPTFDFSTRNIPCKTNPLGLKGAGEAGAIGGPPALVSAVVDAIRPATGLNHIDMPMTPEVIWRALNKF
jgi:aerobic carbon-monoxide dehydrogenase large subunit